MSGTIVRLAAVHTSITVSSHRQVPSFGDADWSPRRCTGSLALGEPRFGGGSAAYKLGQLSPGLGNALRCAGRWWDFAAVERVLEVLDLGFEGSNLRDLIRADIDDDRRRAPIAVAGGKA